MTENTIKKPNPREPYISPLNITNEMKEFAERKEKRAKELGIPLYVLDTEDSINIELQKLEDYIMENFIDLDLDVPPDLKERYLSLKNSGNNLSVTSAEAGRQQ